MKITLLCVYPSYFNATGLAVALEEHCGHNVTQFVKENKPKKFYHWPLHHKCELLRNMKKLRESISGADLVIVCGAMVFYLWEHHRRNKMLKQFVHYYDSLDDFWGDISNGTRTAMIVSDSAIVERDWTKEFSRFDTVFAMPDLFNYVHHPNLYPALQVNHIFKEPRRTQGNPFIGHSPGNKMCKNSKGTNSIIDVLSEISNKGFKFKFKILSDLTHDECIKQKQKMDIFIDQLQDPPQVAVCKGMKPVTGALGKSGQEGMCNGCATITSTNLVSTEPYFPNPPIIVANTTHVLKYQVENLLRHPEYRYTKAKQQYKWAREYLSPEFVSRYIMRTVNGTTTTKNNPKDKTRPFTKFVRATFGSQKLRGVEIGVQRGDNALNILKTLAFEQLFLVDIWEQYKIAKKHKEGFNNADFSGYYPTVLRRFGQRTDVTILKKYSIEASRQFPNQYFDFIYIDACHGYQAVKNDIEVWFPKIKDGGIFGGHDYHNQIYPGLLKAINEFIQNGNYELHQEGVDWWIVK